VCVCVCVCVHVRIASHVASVFTATCSGRGRHTSRASRLNYYYNCTLLQTYSDLLLKIARLQGRSLKNTIKFRSNSCVLFKLLHKMTQYTTHNLLRQVLEVFQDCLPVVKECVCGVTVRVVVNPGQITHSSKRAHPRKMLSGKNTVGGIWEQN
jgi:uncharacterized membrane protein